MGGLGTVSRVTARASAPCAQPSATSAHASPSVAFATRVGLNVVLAIHKPLTPISPRCFAQSGHKLMSGHSGDLVQGPVAALWGGETAALGRDRTALHTVGVVDDHVDVAGFVPTLPVLGYLVHARGAHPAPCFGNLARNVLLHTDVVGRVVARGIAGDEHARELVEGVLAVWLDIDILRLADEHRDGVVAMPIGAARQLALSDLLDARERPTLQQALLKRLARIAHLP